MELMNCETMVKDGLIRMSSHHAKTMNLRPISIKYQLQLFLTLGFIASSSPSDQPVRGLCFQTSDLAMSNVMQELHVAVRSCKVAYPAKQTPELHLFLPNLDLTVVFMVDSVYFYSSGAQVAAEALFKALEETMAEFFPFAGRLEFDSALQRLQIHTNSAGVPVAEAVTRMCIQELGDLSLPNPSFRRLIFTPDNIATFADWPLMTVQVTRFSCGGFSLGLSVNHALADGFGIIQFMNYFTSVARGETPEPPILHFDRSMLRARSSPAPKYDFGEIYYTSREVPQTQSFSTMEDIFAANISSSNYVVSDLVSRTISISAAKVDYLKKLATSDGTVTKCSTFDVVAAYVWKLRSAATEMPPERESVMFMAVDVSKRTDPPLPQGFFGNRAFPVSVKLKTERLLTQPLSSCVRMIQETISAVGDEYVRSWIDWSEIHRGIPKFNGGFYLSSWWKFPFYEMDIGWGKPIYMGPVLTQRVEFALILPVSPTKPSGGIDLLLSLNPQHMSRFETFINFPNM